MTLNEQIENMHVSVKEEDKFNIPLFAITPSRCVQFMNMISVSDLFDEEVIFLVKDDLVSMCENYGEVVALEIPKPAVNKEDPSTSSFSYGVGKLFIKFENIIDAKRARYRISGMQYNNRTVVASFYPEQYFDIKDFNIV